MDGVFEFDCDQKILTMYPGNASQEQLTWSRGGTHLAQNDREGRGCNVDRLLCEIGAYYVLRKCQGAGKGG